MDVNREFMNSANRELSDAKGAEHGEDAERQAPTRRCPAGPTAAASRGSRRSATRYALPFTPSPSIRPASMPRQSRPRDVDTTGVTIAAS